MAANFYKAFLILIAILAIGQFASAQKLPSEQKESVYAPTGVKIDGNPTEWIGKFQAKNSATALTYVMANDEENLYLTIQASGRPTISKILSGGISLVIKNRKDKKTIPVKITYPLVSQAERLVIINPFRAKTTNVDSVAIAVNSTLTKSAKTIAVSGFKDISEPDVSVYNDLGIKAAALVDNTRLMTFEYCVPLKYLKTLLDGNSSFDYSIVVNGEKLPPGTVVVAGYARGSNNSPPPVDDDPYSPTDLTATYTLAKK